jgi:WhiB family redox-sensing transcriptional regulator
MTQEKGPRVMSRVKEPSVRCDRAGEPSPARDGRHRATCRDQEPEPVDRTTGVVGGVSVVVRIAEAKAVCRRCPVSTECLSRAVESGEDSGVWGGMSEDERRAMRRSASPAHPSRFPQPQSGELEMPRVWLAGSCACPSPHPSELDQLVLSDGQHRWDPDPGCVGWWAIDGRHRCTCADLRARDDLIEVPPACAGGGSRWAS